jgi:hypothetical protein
MRTIVTAELQRQYLQTELVLWICFLYYLCISSAPLFTLLMYVSVLACDWLLAAAKHFDK